MVSASTLAMLVPSATLFLVGACRALEPVMIVWPKVHRHASAVLSGRTCPARRACPPVQLAPLSLVMEPVLLARLIVLPVRHQTVAHLAATERYCPINNASLLVRLATSLPSLAP